jgi:subtilisin family serine protease
VYRSLGVAVATLTPSEITRLRALNELVAVLPNEEHHLPGDLREGVLPGIQIKLPEDQAEDGDGEGLGEDSLAQIGLYPGPGVPAGRGVKVAVLNTGVDLAHPDLTVLPGNAASFVASEPGAQDEHGHGTHCAGVVAGRTQPAGGATAWSRRSRCWSPKCWTAAGAALTTRSSTPSAGRPTRRLRCCP